MNVRNVKAARFVAFLALTAVAASLAQAQMTRVQVDVPYPFTFASKQLPAGAYTFSFSAVRDMLLVQSDTSHPVKLMSMIVTRLSGPAAFLQGGSLVFDKSGKGRILSEVWIPGQEGILLHSVPKHDARDVLSFSQLSLTANASGKTAFDLTCARCHGADGRGSAAADQFFKTTIPRLASDAVQRKSDAELRKIITQGTQVMPPVEVEESGYRHRLPPQDVNAVIAYVRSLK